jgi:uncharacterized protein
MIIDLRTILQESRTFEFVLEKDWWRPDGRRDQVLAFDEPLKVKMKIYQAGSKYVLDGALSGALLVSCDRCLDPYRQDLSSVFQVFLALPPTETDQSEWELLEEDLEVDFVTGEEIELDEIIREQIYLSLPMKSICSETCRGLCAHCGGSLNKGNCQCEQERGHPGFLKLKNLKIEGE